ncbi:uncharacterized protein [Antedon mediterranea]|uniref:uncharacterized protein n=1 Tax=Antedon mediterranea TaxID=105859 RepID=UPI003AF81B12
MADVPEARLRIGKTSFFSTGIDCFGPMLIKIKRSQEKRWGVIFKCLTRRLEIVSGMDTFLLALRRFIVRRGTPKEILADCGTNFKGAERELNEAFNNMGVELRERLAKQPIEFKFNPPGAP